MVLLYMVLHGSHQYTPFMLAYIYIPAPWIRHGIWYHIIWVNYNDLTTTSLEIMVSKGNHLAQMALIQVSELL